MDYRDQKGILKAPADEISICSGYSQTKRASFNDNGVLKKILIERLHDSVTSPDEVCSSVKDSATVIEELEETVITVPIEDAEERFEDPEDVERRKVFEEKRKEHEKVNLKELLKRSELDYDKDVNE